MAFENCLFLDAVVDVEELACSLEYVRSIQSRGLSLVGHLGETRYSLWVLTIVVWSF